MQRQNISPILLYGLEPVLAFSSAHQLSTATPAGQREGSRIEAATQVSSA